VIFPRRRAKKTQPKPFFGLGFVRFLQGGVGLGGGRVFVLGGVVWVSAWVGVGWAGGDQSPPRPTAFLSRLVVE